MTRLRRAAIYARLSLTTEESVSIERQLNACRRYAEQHGYAVVLEAVDDNTRATKVAPGKRPGWKSIMAQAQSLDVVVFWKLDRLLRSTRDLQDVLDWSRGSGVGLATVEGELRLDDPMGEFITGIMAGVAQLEAQMIGARSKDARETIVKSGRQAGGRRPWPFVTAPNPDGPGVVLRPIPERAAVIRECYEIMRNRGTLTECARLMAERLDNPKLLDVATVRGILSNPSLCGARVHHGEPVREADGTIRTDPAQAILSVDQWLELRAAVKARRRGPQPSYVELLSGGLLACSGCGGSLSVSKVHGAYQCGRPACTAKVKVKVSLADRLYVEAWLETYGEAHQGELVDRGPDPMEVGRLTEALEAVEQDLGSTRDRDRMLELFDRREALEAALKDLREQGETRPRIEPYNAPTGLSWRQAWEQAEGLDEQRKVLQGIGAMAIVRPGSKGGNRTASYDGSQRLDFSGWE